MGAVGVPVLLARRLVAPLTVYLSRDKQGWSDWPPPVAPPVGAAYGRALVPWAGPSGRGRWTRWRAAPCSISLPWRRSGSASSVLTAPPGLPRCGSSRRVSAGATDIQLVRRDGRIFALANRCSHRGGRCTRGGSPTGVSGAPGI